MGIGDMLTAPQTVVMPPAGQLAGHCTRCVHLLVHGQGKPR
jgi:hypothetical protein